MEAELARLSFGLLLVAVIHASHRPRRTLAWRRQWWTRWLIRSLAFAVRLLQHPRLFVHVYYPVRSSRQMEIQVKLPWQSSVSKYVYRK